LGFINHGKFSFASWAIELGSLINCKVSKQGIFKRTTDAFVKYLKLVIEELISHQMLKRGKNKTTLFARFKNVYLHDSTCYSLPLQLVKDYPGNISVGLKRAVAKVQVVFNLTRRNFSYFELTGYADADTKATQFVNLLLHKGDLIIRDLGYFSMDCFKQIQLTKAYFLSRYKHHVAIRFTEASRPINLCKLLKRKKRLDTVVWLSSIAPFQVRLVAIPVPDAVANSRRRKAQQRNNGSRTNHNKEYFELLGYDIYLTNVPEEIWAAQQIIEAYRCRWFIEIIFKSWKSHLHSHYTDPDRYAKKISIEIHFYLLFIYVCAVVMPIYQALEEYCKKNKNLLLISILKLTSYIAKSLDELLNINLNSRELETIIYYVKYDKRKDRINFLQKYYAC
jgi:hypothetical protein